MGVCVSSYVCAHQGVCLCKYICICIFVIVYVHVHVCSRVIVYESGCVQTHMHSRVKCAYVYVLFRLNVCVFVQMSLLWMCERTIVCAHVSLRVPM